jgi:hypothetical protein
VKALTEGSLDKSMIAGIWHECRDLCKSFNNVRVCFTRREGNTLADRCVKQVSMDSPMVSWLVGIPQWLQDAATIDCNTQLNE